MSTIAAETKRYFQEDVIAEIEDPLLYWKTKKEIFPSLSAMTFDYVSIPTTSTHSERAFSAGRLCIHYTRDSLLSEKIQALMSLNNWNKHEFNQFF
jgi:hypothetical protein